MQDLKGNLTFLGDMEVELGQKKGSWSFSQTLQSSSQLRPGLLADPGLSSPPSLASRSPRSPQHPPFFLWVPLPSHTSNLSPTSTSLSLSPKMPGSTFANCYPKLFWLMSWHIFINGCMTTSNAALNNAALRNNSTNVVISQSMAYISNSISSLLSGVLSQTFYSSHNLDLWVTMYNK